MDTLNDFFEEQIKDLHSAEQQLVKALPKMLKGASTPELKAAIQDHLKQTETHVQRLQTIAEQIGFKPTGKVCAAMKGLVEEGSEALSEKGDPTVIDAAIIAAAQRVEHYEMAAYGTVIAAAKVLGLDSVIPLLEQTLGEEKKADQKLTEVVEGSVYPNAPAEDDEEEPALTGSGGATGRNGRATGDKSAGRPGQKSPK